MLYSHICFLCVHLQILPRFKNKQHWHAMQTAECLEYLLLLTFTHPLAKTSFSEGVVQGVFIMVVEILEGWGRGVIFVIKKWKYSETCIKRTPYQADTLF